MVFSFIKKIRETFRKQPDDGVEGRNQPGGMQAGEARKEPAGGKRKIPVTEKAGTDQEKKQKTRRRKRRRPKKKKKAGVPGGAVTQVPTEPWDISQFQVPEREGNTRFHDFHFPEPLMHAIFDLGFQYCTPIQAQILPAALAGKDAAGKAQTGTGKTAAFLISGITHMLRKPRKEAVPGTPRMLILAPTRELVIQIAKESDAFSKYCGISAVPVYGGMDYQKQRKQLMEPGADIVVATPGRLIDYFEHADVILNQVEILVIDEADRMLDMGFIPQVRRIIRGTPRVDKRQTLLFSATLTPNIMRLAEQWTRNPVVVEIEPEKVEAETVDQIVYLITLKEKKALLFNIITRLNLNRVLIFCNRKDETRRVGDLMERYGINYALLSGDVPQKRRIRTLENFRAGNIRVLVATDVAGRGLHVEGISHVINYTLPNDPERYVHRIGRTGRAGATGTSVSFATEEDSFYLPDIEAFLGHGLKCIYPEEDWLVLPKPPQTKTKTPRRRKKKYTGKNRRTD